MEYNFPEIEKKWQAVWAKAKTFAAETGSSKPKFYVLDMFPYPSGAGLHVGHPLGYIASDIYARYMRHKQYNVLHPMGYDAFGLPAEQYAIKTGQHPAVTTEQNIKRYRQQLDNIGFSFDWDREVRTSDPQFYRWTQWIFLQLFNAWYNKEKDSAEPIGTLLARFSTTGSHGVLASSDPHPPFTAEEWNTWDETRKEVILQHYRLAYRSESVVNWCPALGTVLANDEVKDGFSERGGHPVIQKKMMQWSMRISAYAERLLHGLDTIDWSESIKETQRNWIGRSEGAQVFFPLQGNNGSIEIFTTRPDTIFGATFMVLAPEHPLVSRITAAARQAEVNAYVEQAARKTERDRLADVKHVTGAFTGAYAVNPFTDENIPIWIADYVLAGYGTGAVMAVPGHDSRDHAFAKQFNLPIVEVVAGGNVQEAAWDAKEGKLVNSGFLNGLDVKDAMPRIIEEIEARGLGKGRVNYRLRDAVFGRQRYWGEPIPIYYENGIPKPVKEEHLPLELPEVDRFLPTEDGDPPLGNATHWYYRPDKGVTANGDGFPLELTTMPGWAGSSWYWLRYMDPKNEGAPFSKEEENYWQDVDLYVGGSEHATGHLLYSRFWQKALKDLGYASKEEPFKKLVNQGMIQGVSAIIPVFEIAPLFRANEDNVTLAKAMDTPKLGLSVEKKCYPVSADLISELKEYFNQELPIEYVPEPIRTRILGIIKPIEEQHSEGETRLEFFVRLNLHHRIPIEFVDKNDILDLSNYFDSDDTFKSCDFLESSEGFKTFREVEKMSKSKFNVKTPDNICLEYGADTLRMYEMFLGPLEQSKPWSTQGINGVHNFLRRLWRLYHQGDQLNLSEEKAGPEELRALHKLIKKINEDIPAFSFNTSVAAFMICVNELTELKCNKREVLEPLAVLLSPFAPHVAEELWEKMGHAGGISYVDFPVHNPDYLVENTFSYPVSFNGKTRFQLELDKSLGVKEVEAAVMAHEKTTHYLEGRPPKKVIVVPNRIVNIVI